jgi:NAD(P)-dependent dehydrogenase (short-subunit alcohol dehydrogenase family)
MQVLPWVRGRSCGSNTEKGETEEETMHARPARPLAYALLCAVLSYAAPWQHAQAQTYPGGSVNAGLLSFTKGLAEDCAKDNVLVTGINPGPIDTPRWGALREAAARTRGVPAAEFDGKAAASTALGRLGTAEEVAGLVAFLCSDRASYITGEIINVDGCGTRCI